MFGTLGFSELLIILAIILIIFGAGRLPQIGQGLGQALKGFKKEVHEAAPVVPNASAPLVGSAQTPVQEGSTAQPPAPSQTRAQAPAQAPLPAQTAAASQAPGAPAPPTRPSAIVNTEAIARIHTRQEALRAKAARQGGVPSPQDMQSLGEGIGDALRTFRQAVTDVRGSIEPEVRTIQAELDAAQKEIEQTVESAKQMTAVPEDPPKTA